MIEIVRSGELATAESVPGITRDEAFEDRGVLFGRTRVEAGATSAWHDHGRREFYGFLMSGSLRLDTKDESVDLHDGDYFHIPVGLAHRYVNPDDNVEAVVIEIVLGEGPAYVNVAWP